MRYRTVNDMPVWAREPMQALVNAGAISGTGETENGQPVLDISRDMMRTLIIARSMILNQGRLR